MIPTYTSEYLNKLHEDYIGFNLVAFLIFRPSLGITNTPSVAELDARRALTMQVAASYEIALTNGYSRCILTLTKDVTSTTTDVIYNSSGSFVASSSGVLSPATHICFARGANLSGGSTLNGQNRGSTQGTLIKVEPLLNHFYRVFNCEINFLVESAFKFSQKLNVIFAASFLAVSLEEIKNFGVILFSKPGIFLNITKITM